MKNLITFIEEATPDFLKDETCIMSGLSGNTYFDLDSAVLLCSKRKEDILRGMVIGLNATIKLRTNMFIIKVVDYLKSIGIRLLPKYININPHYYDIPVKVGLSDKLISNSINYTDYVNRCSVRDASNCIMDALTMYRLNNQYMNIEYEKVYGCIQAYILDLSIEYLTPLSDYIANLLLTVDKLLSE